MKKARYGWGTKIVLAIIFFCGFCILCKFFMIFEESEEIEGTVEHTYISHANNGVRPAGGTAGSVPMCSVVWYDKDGDKVTYGMPNDRDYEVGDSYFLEVDAKTNRIPRRSVGEGVASLLIGLGVCITCVIIWIKKFRRKGYEK